MTASNMNETAAEASITTPRIDLDHRLAPAGSRSWRGLSIGAPRSVPFLLGRQPRPRRYVSGKVRKAADQTLARMRGGEKNLARSADESGRLVLLRGRQGDLLLK
jgi:hypothetical protein